MKTEFKRRFSTYKYKRNTDGEDLDEDGKNRL
jgi:hypothetical protein